MAVQLPGRGGYSVACVGLDALVRVQMWRLAGMHRARLLAGPARPPRTRHQHLLAYSLI